MDDVPSSDLSLGVLQAEKHASRFRVLALIGVAATFGAALTKPCVPSNPAEADHPAVVPPQFLPALLAASDQGAEDEYLSEWCTRTSTGLVCVKPAPCTPRWAVNAGDRLTFGDTAATVNLAVVTFNGVQIGYPVDQTPVGPDGKTCDQVAAIGAVDGIVRGVSFTVERGFSFGIIGNRNDLIEFRYWNAAEGKEYFSEYRYKLNENNPLGSFGSDGPFELVLRETPYCPPCASCTHFSFHGMQFPVDGADCVEVEGTCRFGSTDVSCTNADGADCSTTNEISCLPQPSSPPPTTPSPPPPPPSPPRPPTYLPLPPPSPPPPSPSPPPTSPRQPPTPPQSPTNSPLPPPSPPPPSPSPPPTSAPPPPTDSPLPPPSPPPPSPLSPLAPPYELCTYPSQDARCQVTLKIEVCSIVHKCLTIDKPFWAAFICGYCLDNYHNKVKDYNDCFEIGGNQMPAHKYVKVVTKPDGVMLNADYKHNGSNLHRTGAPPAGANTWGAQISELFIKIREGYQWLDLVGNPFDLGKTPTCTQAKTTVYESPSSNYTLAGI